MIAAFQRLELWPPTPPPEGIEDDDCCYEASSVRDVCTEGMSGFRNSGLDGWEGTQSLVVKCVSTETYRSAC
jgi:hypothetical protein